MEFISGLTVRQSDVMGADCGSWEQVTDEVAELKRVGTLAADDPFRTLGSFSV